MDSQGSLSYQVKEIKVHSNKSILIGLANQRKADRPDPQVTRATIGWWLFATLLELYGRIRDSWHSRLYHDSPPNSCITAWFGWERKAFLPMCIKIHNRRKFPSGSEPKRGSEKRIDKCRGRIRVSKLARLKASVVVPVRWVVAGSGWAHCTSSKESPHLLGLSAGTKQRKTHIRHRKQIEFRVFNLKRRFFIFVVPGIARSIHSAPPKPS